MDVELHHVSQFLHLAPFLRPCAMDELPIYRGSNGDELENEFRVHCYLRCHLHLSHVKTGLKIALYPEGRKFLQLVVTVIRICLQLRGLLITGGVNCSWCRFLNQ